MTVANTILNQLGGNQFLAMTGCKNLLGFENGLQMRIPKNGSKANFLKITLKADDTYRMEFRKRIAGHLNTKTFAWIEDKDEEIKVFDGVYCDMLQDLFTEVTKMYTKLF